MEGSIIGLISLENLWPAMLIYYKEILFLYENYSIYTLSYSPLGVGFKSSSIYGLTYCVNAWGSFNAFIKSLNYLREDSPNASAAYINEYIWGSHGAIFSWLNMFYEIKLACPRMEIAYEINWLQAKIKFHVPWVYLSPLTTLSAKRIYYPLLRLFAFILFINYF